jgi:hypothetical protein
VNEPGLRVQCKEVIGPIRIEPNSDAASGVSPGRRPATLSEPAIAVPLNDTAAQLKRVSLPLAAQVCQTPIRYENIQGLHIHPDTY